MSDHTQPPPQPWVKGKHDDHDIAIVEVYVCQTREGLVFSVHQPQERGDQGVLMTWPSGGQRQVAQALLTEALRREAVVGLLVRLSQDPQYLERLDAMTGAQYDAELELLAKAMLETAQRSGHSIAKDIVKEAVAGFQTARIQQGHSEL
jgi:hypothetical protein